MSTVPDCAIVASAFPNAGFSKVTCCTDDLDSFYISCNADDRITLVTSRSKLRAPTPGPIPDALASLTELTDLNLFNASLTGSIPSWLGNLTNLQSLDLASNLLKGTIPDSLGNLGNLTEMWLYDNALTGRVPSTFSKLKKLTTLHIEQNCFDSDPLLGVSIPSAAISVDSTHGPKCNVPSASPTPTPTPSQKSASSPRLSTKAFAASGLLVMGALVGLFM
ncbi:hypothetical protein HDU76_009829 [Blyttiomyces sp. JEL0837]|nr:hypothetical protein HDU76_009829 [Blyttiomyces sp. JEL0837]